MGYCVKVVLIPCEKASVFILMASALINRELVMTVILREHIV